MSSVKVKDCYIQPRKGDAPILTMIDGDLESLNLERYAIIPLEKFHALEKAANQSESV